MSALEEQALNLGERVRIQRPDPPAGSWRRYDHKPGIVVSVRDGEIGVQVGAVQPVYDAQHQLQYDPAEVAWFRPSELRPA